MGITCSIEVLGGEGYSFHKFMRYEVFSFPVEMCFCLASGKVAGLGFRIAALPAFGLLEGRREGVKTVLGGSSHRVERVTWGNSWDQCPPAVVLQQKHLGSFGTFKFFYTLQDLLD